MRILITGASGFIGHAFAEYLLSRGGDVGIWTVRLNCRNRTSVAGLEERGAEVAPGDICDRTAIAAAVKGMEVIVHCAGRSGLGGPMSLYSAANIEGTNILLEESRAAGVRRIVNIGTPSIYFDYTDTMNRAEDYLPVKMADNYAASKYEAEMMLLTASRSDIEAISLRPRFTTGQRETNILGRFIKMHQAGKFRQIGSGENIVDFTAVKNMVDALWLACSAPSEACGEAYNITNGDPVRLWPFLNRLMEKVGLPPITRKVPYPLAAAAGVVVESIARLRGAEPALTKLGAAVMAKTMTMSIEKAKAKLGYRPSQTNEGMLDEFVGWWREVSL